MDFSKEPGSNGKQQAADIPLDFEAMANEIVDMATGSLFEEIATKVLLEQDISSPDGVVEPTLSLPVGADVVSPPSITD
jgi:hypothetical protein